MVVSLTLLGRFIAHGRVQIMRVIIRHPPREGPAQLEGAGPFLQPQALLFEGTEDPLRVSIALWVVIAGEGLPNPQRAAGLQKGRRRRLAAVVTPQRQLLPPRPMRQVPLARPISSCQPWLRRARRARLVADALVRLPLQPDHEVNPAEAFHPHLGQVKAPPLMGRGRSGGALLRRPLGRQLQGGRDHEVVFSHQARHALLSDHAGLDAAQGRPASPITPEWGLGLQPPEMRQQGVITMDALTSSAPLQPRPSSRLFHSRRNAPTRCFSLACSRSRRVAFRVC